jgi:hypothetical protein
VKLTKKEYDRQRYKKLKRFLYKQNRTWQKMNKKKWVGYALARLKRRQQFLARLKNRPCMDCYGWFEPCQMDFDHRKGTVKYRTISKLWACKLKILCEEMRKCDLVCANCHRLRTYRRNHAI